MRLVVIWFDLDTTNEKYPIAPSIKHATGKELKELEAEQAGEILFNRDPITGPFGTKDKPACIPSGNDDRIVGCVGPSDNEHEPYFFKMVQGGPMMRCRECSQVFKLVKI
jgi:hypothetical protein